MQVGERAQERGLACVDVALSERGVEPRPQAGQPRAADQQEDRKYAESEDRAEASPGLSASARRALLGRQEAQPESTPHRAVNDGCEPPLTPFRMNPRP